MHKNESYFGTLFKLNGNHASFNNVKNVKWRARSELEMSKNLCKYIFLWDSAS